MTPRLMKVFNLPTFLLSFVLLMSYLSNLIQGHGDVHLHVPLEVLSLTFRFISHFELSFMYDAKYLLTNG